MPLRICAIPYRSVRLVPQLTTAAHDYGTLTALPDGFGDGEFAFMLWVKPTPSGSTVNSLTIDTGSTASVKEARWSSDSSTVYGAADWWFLGNFLIDGHNNNAFENGTFSLQLTASGRVQWTFGDGAAAGARTGDLHGLRGTTDIRDGAWHSITCVRRWDGGSGAELELWIDGTLEDSETSSARTDVAATYWDSGFPSYPAGERNWTFGTEKQAAAGSIEYEDYFGLIDSVRFYNRAPTTTELGNESITSGLVGEYRFSEGAGASSADTLGGASISWNNQHASFWVLDDGAG